MTSSGTLRAGLSLLLTLGAACAPSSSPGLVPHVGADSAPAEIRDESPAPESTPIASCDPAPVPDVAVAPPPRPPVTGRPVYLPRPTGPFGVRVVDEAHHDLPRFASGGRSYVMGSVGSRYSVVVTNPTSRRVEVVLSVDGLDAMDGQPSNYAEKRGYIVPPYGDATIDGFRTSLDDVATFRFSSVESSYAGRLGQARDVGVIGVAFFPERPPVAVQQQPVYPRPQPIAPRGSSPPPAPKAAPVDDMARDALSSSAGDVGGDVSPASPAPPSAGAGGGGRSAASEQSPRKRAGLGTEFGEARESRIETTVFVRANPSRPSQLVAIRYNDRAGLVALGIVMPQPPPYATAETDLHLRETADPFRANRFAQPPP